MSPQTGMERLGQVQDIQTELNLIKLFMEEFGPLMNPKRTTIPSGAGQDGEQAQAERPKQPAAASINRRNNSCLKTMDSIS
jgi:hypothetical protein